MKQEEKKARRLITIFHNEIHDNDPKIHWKNAKRCALIAVNEILNSNICFIGKGSPAEKDFGKEATKEFWQAVKTEIKQL